MIRSDACCRKSYTAGRPLAVLSVQTMMEDAMTGDTFGVSSFLKLVTMSYFSFVFAYCLSIIAALLVGGVGRLVPVSNVWWQIVGDLFVQSSDLAFRVFISILPLIVLLNLNYIWFRRLLTSKPLVAGHVFVQTVFGVIVALPILILSVGMIIVSSELLGFWETLRAWAAIFFLVLLLYMLVLTFLSGSGKRRVLARSLLNPGLWVQYVLVSLMLLFPAASVIYPFFKGYWTNIPMGYALEYFLKALSVSLILPALPYIFARFRVRIDSVID